MNMTAVDYSNQRRHRRVYLSTDVAVFDVISGERMGEVVNITVEGLMLVTERAMETGSIYQLALALPESVDEHQVINVGAECLWSSPTSVAGHNWAGFQIIDASSVAETLIQHLIATYASA